MKTKTTTETREAIEKLFNATQSGSPRIPKMQKGEFVNQIMQLIQQEKQDLLVSLLDKYNEVDEECEKAGYGTGFVNYVGILESWIEDFEKLAELKGEK